MVPSLLPVAPIDKDNKQYGFAEYACDCEEHYALDMWDGDAHRNGTLVEHTKDGKIRRGAAIEVENNGPDDTDIDGLEMRIRYDDATRIDTAGVEESDAMPIKAKHLRGHTPATSVG